MGLRLRILRGILGARDTEGMIIYSQQNRQQYHGPKELNYKSEAGSTSDKEVGDIMVKTKKSITTTSIAITHARATTKRTLPQLTTLQPLRTHSKPTMQSPSNNATPSHPQEFVIISSATAVANSAIRASTSTFAFKIRPIRAGHLNFSAHTRSRTRPTNRATILRSQIKIRTSKLNTAAQAPQCFSNQGHDSEAHYNT